MLYYVLPGNHVFQAEKKTKRQNVCVLIRVIKTKTKKINTNNENQLKVNGFFAEPKISRID